MKCKLCKWNLNPRYAKYKDVVGNPYCQQCYIVIGGTI